MREFIAPHDGIVVDVFKSGARRPRPVFHMVDSIDSGNRLPGSPTPGVCGRASRPGIPRRARRRPAGEREVFRGRVSFVDHQVGAEQTCKVVAELENRDRLLRAGLPVRMEILIEGTPTAAPEAPGEPAAAAR